MPTQEEILAKVRELRTFAGQPAPQLAQLLFEQDQEDRLVAAGKTKIVLDLARVTRIDSAGIGMLVSKYLTAFRKGGRLKLLHLTRRADNALHLTKLSSVFEVFDSEDEAVASFKFLPRKHGTSV